MILDCNYEELRALASGAELLLSSGERESSGSVAAPSEAFARVSTLQDELDAPIEVRTLAEQRVLADALSLITSHLRQQLDATLIEHHPALERAINLYFDFGHSLSVKHRLDQIGEQMEALIELMTGEPPTDETAETITFDA